MGENNQATILDVVSLANSMRRELCSQKDVEVRTLILNALASGVDVVLTIMEESVGHFAGLAPDSAQRIAAYFRHQASKSESGAPELWVWYMSWAMAIESVSASSSP